VTTLIGDRGRLDHRRSKRLRWAPARLLQYALLIVILAINVLPLIWIAISALKSDSEIVQYPPTGLPVHPTLQSFVELFTTTPFGQYMLNSAIVSTVTTGAVITLGMFAAFALARFDYRWIRGLGELSLFAYMVPSILLLVPLLRIMFFLHLDNSLWSLIIIYTTLTLPFALWTLRSYFQGVAAELEEAAMVDGCTRFGAFIRVVVPQAVPGLIATAIFTFNAAWSEFLFASTLMTSPDRLTISPGLLQILPSTGIIRWGLIMAACVAMVLPVLFLFLYGQRQLVETWGEGALRG
jgi:ABC-type glycerol-3-phosphate transport system permease component